MKELILQPQSEIVAFRKFLRQAGLRIVAEDMVLEEGKFYPMMRVVPDVQNACEDAIAGQQLEDLYGGFLLKEKHPVLLKFLEYQKEKLTQLLQDLEKAGKESEKSRTRMEEVRQEIRLNKAAMEWYN
jgi:tRNA (adenine22-N1)-methyltransferase